MHFQFFNTYFSPTTRLGMCAQTPLAHPRLHALAQLTVQRGRKHLLPTSALTSHAAAALRALMQGAHGAGVALCGGAFGAPLPLSPASFAAACLLCTWVSRVQTFGTPAAHMQCTAMQTIGSSCRVNLLQAFDRPAFSVNRAP